MSGEHSYSLHIYGKGYNAFLSNPSGSGGNDHWDLLINQRPRGVLSFKQRDVWCFHTQAGRFDEWALMLVKFVQDALPDRDFTPELPLPFKMFEFAYEGDGLKTTVEVHNLQVGNYYVNIKDTFVHCINRTFTHLNYRLYKNGRLEVFSATFSVASNDPLSING